MSSAGRLMRRAYSTATSGRGSGDPPSGGERPDTPRDVGDVVARELRRGRQVDAAAREALGDRQRTARVLPRVERQRVQRIEERPRLDAGGGERGDRVVAPTE